MSRLTRWLRFGKVPRSLARLAREKTPPAPDIEPLDGSHAETLVTMARLLLASDGSHLRVAEIGVADGNTSLRLLAEFQSLTLTGVDPYVPFGDADPYFRHFSAENFEAFYQRAAEKYNRFPERATLFREASCVASARFPDHSFDLVFIDASHEYEDVRRDIELWRPRVRPGGVLAGHDFHHVFPGVMRAVREAFAGRYFVGAGYVWFVVE